MVRLDEVRSLVATMLLTSPEQLGPETALGSLDNSLGGTRLRLGLKRLGINPSFQRVPATYGGLERCLAEVVGPVSEVLQATSVDQLKFVSAGSGSSRLSVGMDLQDLKSLPDVLDYWENEFYQGSFSRAELAYAVVQSNPKTHFAGFWCAKEALKKCDSAFLETDLSTLTVAHEPSGRPYFLIQTSNETLTLPHALSISHIGAIASAVVVYLIP